MPVTGPDFISLQARALDASQAFYEQYLGLTRSPAGPPHAVVFETTPIAFALRTVVPGTDLASVAQPGIGAATSQTTTHDHHPEQVRPRPKSGTHQFVPIPGDCMGGRQSARLGYPWFPDVSLIAA